MSAGRVDSHAVLALVGFEPDVAFPLRLKVAFLCGDAFGGTEQGIAAEVFVAFLGKWIASLISFAKLKNSSSPADANPQALADFAVQKMMGSISGPRNDGPGGFVGLRGLARQGSPVGCLG